MSTPVSAPAPVSVPVSVKAALRCGHRWVLVRNERGEWELPGGRIDPLDDSLEAVVQRECREELGVEVQVGGLVDAYLFEVVAGRRVTIVCYAASVPEQMLEQLTLSDEHDALGLFTKEELDALRLPAGYRRAISKATS